VVKIASPLFPILIKEGADMKEFLIVRVHDETQHRVSLNLRKIQAKALIFQS
jgi:VCBS repeat-containing protein